MAAKNYREMFREAQESPEYWAEVAIGDFTEELYRLMTEKKITRSELANRIGSSPAYVTKVLGGNANFTLASMAKFAMALDSQLRLHLAPKESRTTWSDLLFESEGLTWKAMDTPELKTEEVFQQSIIPGELAKKILEAYAEPDVNSPTKISSEKGSVPEGDYYDTSPVAA